MVSRKNFTSSANATSPAGGAAAITPSDSTNMTYFSRAIYVGTGGNLVAVFEDDTAVTFTNVQDGSIIPISVKRINSTSTTATNLVALF